MFLRNVLPQFFLLSNEGFVKKKTYFFTIIKPNKASKQLNIFSWHCLIWFITVGPNMLKASRVIATVLCAYYVRRCYECHQNLYYEGEVIRFLCNCYMRRCSTCYSTSFFFFFVLVFFFFSFQPRTDRITKDFFWQQEHEREFHIRPHLYSLGK